MERIMICTLPERVGALAKVQGFIRTIRDQKSLMFIVIEDRSGLVQIVCDKSQGLCVDNVTIGSAITVMGKVVAAPQVKQGQGVEIHAQSLIVESQADTPLPIAADSSLDKKLDWRYLMLRDPKARLIFEVKTTLIDAMRVYWAQQDFIEIHSPKLMGTASESGAEVFTVNYFDQKAYLAQSPQFYKQMAMAAGFERIFEIGPVFRAEPSFTSRHATEYISIDMEIAWLDDPAEIMRMESEMLVYALQAVKDKHGTAIAQYFDVEVVVPTLPFPRITLHDARDILAEQGHVIAHKDDLDPAGERLLSRYALQRYGHEFIYVTDYPASIRAFYHRRHADDPTLTHSFDLLWKGLEITTGALREHRVDRLAQQALDKAMSLEPIADYLDFFRYGCPPHGGCGIGLERLVMLLLEIENIRDVAYLFRGPHRLTP